MSQLAITSLIFGTFSGWLSGDNRGTLLGRMIAFAAFVAISGLYIASVTAISADEERYFTALWAYGIAYVIAFYVFARLSERRAQKKSLIAWRGDNIQMDLADFVATLSAVLHLSDEQLKATSSVLTTIRQQLESFKEDSEKETARSLAMKRAKDTELE